MNKRGVSGGGIVVGIIIAIVLIVVIGVFISTQNTLITPPGDVDSSTQSFSEVYNNNIFVFLDYIVGGVPNFLINLIGSRSAAIVVISIWLLLFITFGDILSSFSTFSESVSWLAGLLLAIIAANLKLVVAISVISMGTVATLGALAVAIGMGATFVAFIAVNLAIPGLGNWILRRKMLMEAQKSSAKIEAGGTKLSGIIGALGKTGEEFEKLSKKKVPK